MRRNRSLLIVAVLALLVLGAPNASPDSKAPQAITPGLMDKIQYLYVDARTGDDKNPCDALDRACLSLQAAFDRIPPILSEEVLVMMAPGTYTAGAVLRDRLSPRGLSIHVLGEGGGTFLDGRGEVDTGIAVYRAPGVTLTGLSVTGFRQAGLSFDHTAPIEISSTRIYSNLGVGVQLQNTEAVVTESIVDENGGHGILCDVGRVDFRSLESGNGVIITRNGGNGVRAIGCHAIFDGPATVSLNRSGLVAEHGAEINLMNRTDVRITGNTASSGGTAPPPELPPIKPVPLSHLALCELTADNHGVIAGYRNTPLVSACVCLESHFGVCDPD